MTYKIFYHPETLKIMGSSDGADSMQFPWVETETYYHALENLAVEKDEKGEAKLIVVKGYLTDDDIGKLQNHKT